MKPHTRCKIPFMLVQTPLTWSRHLMRSPGAMMAVVKTPESMPAAKSWGYLGGRRAQGGLFIPQTRGREGARERAREWEQVELLDDSSPTWGCRRGFSAVTSCQGQSRRNRPQTWASLQWWGQPCLYTGLSYPVMEGKQCWVGANDSIQRE